VTIYELSSSGNSVTPKGVVSIYVLAFVGRKVTIHWQSQWISRYGLTIGDVMNNVTRETFQPLFEGELQLLNNPICHQCDAQIRHPLLPWLVGAKFSDSDERIMFVGKPHRNIPGDVLPSGIIDPTNLVAEELWDVKWPYWSYTREIAEKLYGENAHEFIAFTNLIKCTNVGADDDDSTSTDKTSYNMAESCVLKLGVTWKEIERLKARTVVFYTYGLYREMLQNIPFAIDGSIHEITPINHSVPCKNKQLGWWERKCKTAWTDNLRILVAGHPQFMGKEDFVELLTNWLRPSQN
jgi:hypothetical protein